MEDLPLPLLEQEIIENHLTAKDFISLCQTSLKLSKLCQSERVWKHFVKQDIPEKPG